MDQDTDPYSEDQLLQAYGAASKAGDKEAMDDLHQRYSAAVQRRVAAQADPTAGMSGGSRYLAGMGHGMERLAQGAGNMVGLGHVFPSYFGNEQLKNEDETAKPLLNTTAGNLGDLSGQIAATLPLSGVGGGAGTLAKLGSAAASGGLQSAAMADPDEQLSQGAKGAVLGSAMSALGKGAGRVVKGLVNKSPEAEELIQRAANGGRDIFIPISQGAADSGVSGATKNIYQNVLPYALGVEGKLDKQSNAARRGVQESMANLAADAADIPRPNGNTMQQVANKLGVNFDKAYEDRIKNYAFQVPEKFDRQIAANIRTANPNVPSKIADEIANSVHESLLNHVDESGTTITGDNLLNAMGDARTRLERLAVDRPNAINPPRREAALQSLKDIVQDAVDEHRDMIYSGNLTPPQIGQAQQVVRDLKGYFKLGEGWKEAAPVMEAAEAAKADMGNFTGKQVADRAADETHAQGTAQLLRKVLEKESPGGVNPAGRHLAHTMGQASSVLLPGGAALMGHPGVAVGGLGALAAGNALATQSAQKFLYGDYGVQQALANFVRNHPNLSNSLGGAVRAGGIQESE